jgi:hydrogenase maturation protease
VLILGIGNLLMGDEGVGVHFIRALEGVRIPAGVECLDGGTGGFHLLGPLREASKVVLVDAAADDTPEGTVRRLVPRYSSDYPSSLTAHDIGLKDLLDAIYLLDDTPRIVLFTVSINPRQQLGTELSSPVAAAIPGLIKLVLHESRTPEMPVP